MPKIVLKLSILIGSLIIFISMTGCSRGVAENPTPPRTAQATAKLTDLARLLSFVPNSFLERTDIWFSNPEDLKKINNLENIDSQASLGKLSEAERKEALNKMAGISLPPLAGAEMLFPLDSMMVNQAVFTKSDISNQFFIIEGSFDTSLIINKLLEGGYQKTDYKSYTYYKNDVQMTLSGDINVPYSIAKTFSRVAVQKNALVIAAEDENMQLILGAMNNINTSVIANTACSALVKSLGDVQFAVLIPPERIMLEQNDSGVNMFDLAAASFWPKLHNYTKAALAFRDNGSQREWLVSLYYADKNEAEADAVNLKARLESYIFNSHKTGIEDEPLIASSEVGDPSVTPYGAGATLIISNRYKEGVSPSQMRIAMMIVGNDLLFLAPDPAPFLKK
jgi:regulator of sigma D